ncbi:MAG: serine/threonine protein kinase [Ktedonobacterales bacterium]|jgi:serine/threonine-protein kinase|nr:MAG: serine/threonine protein kinase [Ktedonobacterales bacterium]
MYPLADRYRVLARVGLGGTAVVYRCVDLHTEHIVAVKVLRTSGPMIPEAEARFQREAHLSAALSHAAIVRVLDYGYTLPLVQAASGLPWLDDSRQPVPYVAMEYIFGTTLKELIRQQGALPFDWIWRIGEQLCAALGVAHAAGVVHRDVKPQNVMILDSRLELTVKLTDFGIARQVGTDLTTLTATGQVIGTPDYLSPEQVLGETGSPSSDLYSLGVVLYELATGRLPFVADTPLAVASKRMLEDPPLLTAFRPDVPRALQEVILLALRREADERFRSAAEFAQALRWSRQQSPPTAPGEDGAWVVRPRRRSAAAGQPPEPLPRDTEEREERDDREVAIQSTVMRVAPLAGK